MHFYPSKTSKVHKYERRQQMCANENWWKLFRCTICIIVLSSLSTPYSSLSWHFNTFSKSKALCSLCLPKIKVKQDQLHGGAVQVEANLPWKSTVIAHILLQMGNKKMIQFEHEGRIAQNLQLCNSMTKYQTIRHYRFFGLALTIYKLLTFKFVHFEILDQCLRVQHSRYSNSMANINL